MKLGLLSVGIMDSSMKGDNINEDNNMHDDHTKLRLTLAADPFHNVCCTYLIRWEILV